MSDNRTLIQAAMRAAFPVVEQRVADFYGMQAYQLGWRDERLNEADFDPGKLLRPRLCLLACEAAGGNTRSALPLAAAIQLVHDFSLIHDDIEDNSETRRGRATVWNVWGLAQGINAGDGLLIVAHLAVHRLSEAGVAPATVLDVARRFDQAILTVCEGQYLDIKQEGSLKISAEDYLAMISRKTAALVEAAIELGAVVGGADPDTARTLGSFGQLIGLAFQIQDDVLGIWGDPATTGKPAAADVYQRKISLPVIHALATAEQRDLLAQIYGQPQVSAADVQQVLTILDHAEARQHTERMAAHYHQRALEALDSVRGDDAALGQMRALAEGLVGRNR